MRPTFASRSQGSVVKVMNFLDLHPFFRAHRKKSARAYGSTTA
jgi:hypothetical protein